MGPFIGPLLGGGADDIRGPCVPTGGGEFLLGGLLRLVALV